jgi:hypothetical protein
MQCFSSFDGVQKRGTIASWSKHASARGASPTHMPFLASVRNKLFAAFSAIRRRASSRCIAAQKNSLRRMRMEAPRLVRPAHAADARSVVGRYARLPEVRGTACGLSALRRGEARAARFSGRQSVLHETFRPVRRATLPKLAANKRLNTAYLLKESFGQLWSYQREGWARRFFSSISGVPA